MSKKHMQQGSLCSCSCWVCMELVKLVGGLRDDGETSQDAESKGAGWQHAIYLPSGPPLAMKHSFLTPASLTCTPSKPRNNQAPQSMQLFPLIRSLASIQPQLPANGALTRAVLPLLTI